MKLTTGKYFLDTNFLIYCFSSSEERKQAQCLSVLKQGKNSVRFVLSTQVLSEFTSVMISKYNADPRTIKQIIEDLRGFEIVRIDQEMILSAIDIHILFNYSFWDSMIITAAKESNCSFLLTEDMRDGHHISGLTITNPFL
jgi:predicted nucleic acid-binding protein